jgi:CRP-like cAMP-binding protein
VAHTARDTVSTVTLESVLGSVSFFEHLRPDELARIAQRFELRRLAPGEKLEVAPEAADQRLVVVVHGEVALEVEAKGRTLKSVLVSGDRYGDVGLLAKLVRRSTFTAREPAEVAVLDAAGLDAVIAEFPAIAPPLAEELASEVSFSNDLVRQLLELWAEGLSPDQRSAALAERRAALERRGAKVSRSSVRALFRRVVVERGAEPPFWATVGFLVSLAGARAVVALILKYGLEKRLFALVPGDDPHPMHVHHFNYGLLLIALAGLSALFPLGRKALRALAFVFGAGAGLVFDEFALFWNLNPEYAQTLSLYSAAIALVMLANLTWFREFWVAVARRAWYRAGGGR